LVKNHFQRYTSIRKDNLSERWPPGSHESIPVCEIPYIGISDPDFNSYSFTAPVSPGEYIKASWSMFRTMGMALNFELFCGEVMWPEGPLENRAGRWDSEGMPVENETGVGWDSRFWSTGYVPAGATKLTLHFLAWAYGPGVFGEGQIDNFYITANGRLIMRLRGEAEDFPEGYPDA